VTIGRDRLYSLDAEAEQAAGDLGPPVAVFQAGAAGCAVFAGPVFAGPVFAGPVPAARAG
jgi:hypothetical protein